MQGALHAATIEPEAGDTVTYVTLCPDGTYSQRAATTYVLHLVGVGDRAALGASHLAHEGLLKRAITSALVDSPGLVRLAAENKIGIALSIRDATLGEYCVPLTGLQAARLHATLARVLALTDALGNLDYAHVRVT